MTIRADRSRGRKRVILPTERAELRKSTRVGTEVVVQGLWHGERYSVGTITRDTNI